MIEINGVKMIPSSLVNCLIEGNEVRITELASEAFQIRTANRLAKPMRIQMNFFIFEESRYEEIQWNQVKLMEMVEKPFYYLYTFAVADEAYRIKVAKIIQSYTKYIMLKMSGDDSYCSQEMVGYPANLEEEYAPTFQAQKKEWFEELGRDEINYEGIELAVGIDCPSHYERYLQLGIHEFVDWLLQENSLKSHPIARAKVERVYLGNQFCHNLFPDRQLLFAMMERARMEDMHITVVTTYLREERISEAISFVDELYEWCKRWKIEIELVINDWGMAKLLYKKNDWIQPVLGILLNKRRKDPRYSYKSGFAQYASQLAKNNLSVMEYREFLNCEFGMKRYEYESCGYPINLPSRNHSLHIPYYQTNTSSYCTLYAKCTQGDRGKQVFAKHCPKYCEGLVFTYPKHLKMVGRYNSIFGMDDSLLKNRQQVEWYQEHGIDRFVLTLL